MFLLMVGEVTIMIFSNISIRYALVLWAGSWANSLNVEILCALNIIIFSFHLIYSFETCFIYQYFITMFHRYVQGILWIDQIAGYIRNFRGILPSLKVSDYQGSTFLWLEAGVYCKNSRCYVSPAHSDLDTLRLRQNGCHIADSIFNFKFAFLNENIYISIQISFKFISKGRINNKWLLVKI